MSWILVMYFAMSPDTLAREFATKAECMEAKSRITEMEKRNKDIEKIVCEQGIVISENDDY